MEEVLGVLMPIKQISHFFNLENIQGFNDNDYNIVKQ